MAPSSSVPPATLVLVKDACPAIVPSIPAVHWPLSEAGRASCEELARALAPWAPEALIASEEIKAAEMARLAAGYLSVPWWTAPGLHEHDRAGAPFFASETAFAAAVEALFLHPDDLVYGNETASAALARFTAALETATAGYAGRSMAVVAHGAVIALYTACLWGMDARAAYALWERLGLPALAAVRAPGLAAPVVIERVG